MAVWSLDLIPYSIEDAINTTRRLPPRNSRTYAAGNPYRTSGKIFNSTILIPSATTLASNVGDNVIIDSSKISPLNSSTTTSEPQYVNSNSTAVTRTVTNKRKKILTKKKKLISKTPPKNSLYANNTKFVTRSEKDLLPKSNMQVLQFYAQPLNSVALRGQTLPTFTDDDQSNAPVLVNPASSPTAISHSQVYMAPSPFGNTMSYGAVPEQYANPFKPVNYNVGLERPALSTLPLIEPYNVYKRNPKPKNLPLVPIQSAQKFVASIRPVTPSVPIVPPVTVTRVYKYTEDGDPSFRLPFLENEDPIDENLPILSAALDDRLNNRVAGLGIRNYLTPPKFGQPIIYNNGPRARGTLPEVYRNEFQVLNKFNENLQAYPVRISQSSENGEVEHDRENYSEEEVKKALKYIQRLKKRKPSPSLSRGRATYKNSQQFRNVKRKPKENNNKENLENDLEDDDIEPEQINFNKKKRKKEEHDPFHISDDDEGDDTFQVKSFTEDVDKNQEESRTKPVKANKQSIPRSIEIPASPAVNDENDEYEPFENAGLGIENDGDDRVEFQMHGLGGPESYKFGYDTGKGENRQFRYEERDANGKVKGHYGYYDMNGKLQLFNYEADPEQGYHLEKAAEH